MLMPASLLREKTDYPNFPEFRKYGIDLSFVEAGLITTLQNIREDTGIPITPSPVKGAWYRLDGSKTSRHYAVGRLSDAGDIFPQKDRVLDLWLMVQEVTQLGGIGLYADTNGPDGKPWSMMHIDLRVGRLLWASELIGKERKYYYLPGESRLFWKVVEKVIRQIG